MSEDMKNYLVVGVVFVAAIAIVILRAKIAGVPWNPLGLISGTKPANNFTGWQKLLAGAIIIVGGLVAARWANNMTKEKGNT